MLTMTLQTPTHGEWSHLFYAIHSFNRTMAPLAGNTGAHVLAMVEVDKVGKVVDLYPCNWPLLQDRFLELLDLDGLLFHDTMTIHAYARRRNAGMPAGPGAEVAIETGNFIVPGMDLVGKGDGLTRGVTLMNADAGELPRGNAPSQADDANE